MNPIQKTLLTTVFEALGPGRVTRGLTATGHSWRDCFLSLAMYGEPDALARELEKRWRKEHYVSTLLGVRVQAVNEVVRAWDADEGAFRALAAEWLELNRVPAATAAAVGT
jgi:hypothetical protein